MDRIRDRLAARANAAPHDRLLADTVALLNHRPVDWDALRRNLDLLRDRGTEIDDLLDDLRMLEPLSIAMPPAQNLPSQLVDHLLLPVELVGVLNNACFLHVLATDPAQVLPPGKSLLSVMSRIHSTADTDTKPTLRNKVEGLVHKAFWDEAVSTLSSSEPSVQLPRVKLLYADLHVALSPLLPPKHPVLVTLSSPLSPTSSPLTSALMHLREILIGLRERCAPARDSEIEALQRQLDDPVRSSSPVALATLVAETVRNILKLSEIMKDDLSQFVLGSMTEQQLQSVVAKQAKTMEREVVISIWHRDGIMRGWRTWLDTLRPSSISTESHFLWIGCIVQALASSSPVSCPLPSETAKSSTTASPVQDKNETAGSPVPHANTLPPAFFFSAPTLLKIQNYLQALVIAASLRILMRLPPPTRSSQPDPDSFMFRVWTLLHAEIAGEPDASDTKLINLADEVVHARTQAATTSISMTKEDEDALRAAVDRTLRPEDPVFKLLQRRLLTALSDILVKRRQGESVRDTGTGAGPSTLRTGREGPRAGKRPRLVLDLEDMDESRAPTRSPLQMAADVKGFEDPVLSRAVVEVFQQIDDCLGWVESVWGDIIEAGNVGDAGSLPRKG